MQYVIFPTRYGNACNMQAHEETSSTVTPCTGDLNWFACAQKTKNSLHRLQKDLTCNCVACSCTGDLSALMTPPRRQIEGSENQTSLTAGVLLVLLKLAWLAQCNLKALIGETTQDAQDVLLSWPCQIWWRLLKAQSLGIWQWGILVKSSAGIWTEPL